jgi:AIR synthase-related protein
VNATKPESDLAALAAGLRVHPSVAEKLAILRRYAPCLGCSGGISVGDDTAVLPDANGGFLLFAAEGMMESFMASDPWFAGYCAVMVNLSDVAAMGGRPVALVNVLWAHEAAPGASEIWAGLQAASRVYGVPIVGGHTAHLPFERTPLLAAAIIGRAKNIISSFTARPGDTLLMAVDLRGSYRGESTPFWNASTDAPPGRLRDDLEILPALAEAGLVTAGKDISNGGLPGTLAMLLATSRCGATVSLEEVPRPPGVPLAHWLTSFPSFGFLLTGAPAAVDEIARHFQARDIACSAIGRIEAGNTLWFAQGSKRVEFAQVTPAPPPPSAAGSLDPPAMNR